MRTLTLLILLIFSIKSFAIEIFRIEVQGNGFADETVVVFSPNASDTFNLQEDSPKLFSGVAGVPGICTRLSGNYVAINNYSPLMADLVVEVVLKIQSAGNYTLYASEFVSLNQTCQIFLEDQQSGTIQDFRQNQYYSCQLGTGMIQSRFFIHFRAPIITQSTIPSCSNNDAEIIVNYNSSDSVLIDITDQSGDTIIHLLNFSGTYTQDSITPGNYTINIVFSNSATVNSFLIVQSNYPVQNNLQILQNPISISDQAVLILQTVNSVQNIWNFGDGTNQITNYNNITHTYNHPGQYVISVISTNSICSDTAFVTIDVLDVSGLIENSENYLKSNFIISDIIGREIRNEMNSRIFITFDGKRYKKTFQSR